MKKNVNCIFCKLANHEIQTNIVYEDEDCVAFLDNSPVAKGHTLVVSKEHFENFLKVPQNILNHMFVVAQKISQSMLLSLHADGFNIVTNVNESAGQSVMHFHIHIIPRYSDDKRKMLECSPYLLKKGEYLQIADSIKSELDK